MSLEDDVRELKRIVSELSRNTSDIPVRWASGGSGSGSGDSSGDGIVCRVSEGGTIDARVGDVPGHGTVDIYTVDGDGNLSPTGDTATAYNVSSRVAGDSSGYLQAKMVQHIGYVLDFEECD